MRWRESRVVRRLLLVGVLVALTVIAIPSPGVAWAASNRSGVGAQVPAAAAETWAEAEAEAAQQAAQQRAAQQQAAQQQAAQQAAVTGPASLPSTRRGQPARLVIVRARSIDAVAAGHLVQRVVRNGRAMSLGRLDAAIPSSWMTIAGDTARSNAAVVLSPSTLLDVQGVHILQLAGGTDAAAAFLDTGSGRIRLRGVTVTSIDPATGHPVAAGAAGRPYIKVSG